MNILQYVSESPNSFPSSTCLPRDQLVSERQELDDKLHEDKSLSSREERRMIELDESVEALDGAIEHKNEIMLGNQVRSRYITSYY